MHKALEYMHIQIKLTLLLGHTNEYELTRTIWMQIAHAKMPLITTYTVYRAGLGI